MSLKNDVVSVPSKTRDQDSGQFRVINKWNNLAIALFASVGATCSAIGFQGTQQSLTEYCFKPNNNPKYCTTDKRYVMPTNDFESSKNSPTNPEFQKANEFDSSKATRLQIIPATNHNKPFWYLASTIAFVSAAGIADARAKGIAKDLPLVRQETKTNWAIEGINHILSIKNAQYTAAKQHELHQFKTDRKIEDKMFSKMSPAELEAHANNLLLQQTYRNQNIINNQQQVALLNGQSLEQTTSPVNKIESDTQVSTNTQIIDLISEITKPVRNCVVFGVGGSGKGVLVSNAIRKIKSDNPNKKIFYIDPKNDPNEHGYIDGICDAIRRKTCFGVADADICSWMNEVLDEYRDWSNLQEESLLIIDEGTILGSAAKKCKDTRIGSTITHISSLGGSGFKNVWLLAQAPFVGSLGLDLATSSQITAIAIVSGTNTGVMEQWKSSKIINSLQQDELNRYIKLSPVGRAVYFGGTNKWYSMPKLENYSKIDRDNKVVKSD